MDALCERLDKLTLDYLEQFGHLLACKQLLDDTIKKGYFALSHARVIMGVNNLSRLQYSERQPMIAATTVTDFEKHIQKDHIDDALKWFGLFSPQILRQSQKYFQQTIDLALEACRRQASIIELKTEMNELLKEKQYCFMATEPKSRIQIVRSHQNLNEYTFQNEPSIQSDYYAIGWKRLNLLHLVPLSQTWPIVIGTAASAGGSGLIGALTTRRMARNLCLHVTQSIMPSSGACFFVVALSHLTTYYYFVLRQMVARDPMVCSTCMEIRSFAIGSFIPVTMGTSIAVLANLSTCLLHKTIRLPEFHWRALQDWQYFFRKHAFKGMSRRYFVVFPLINGFVASLLFLGQDYYWRNHLEQVVINAEHQSLLSKESKPRSQIFGPVQDFFTRLFGSKSR